MDKRIQDLKRYVNELSNKLAEQGKHFTARLATRMTKAAQQHPQDHTIVQFASFLNHRANVSGNHFITKKELIDVYNKLYTTNTKCASYLQEELGIKNNLPNAPKMTRSAREGEPIEDLYSKHADQRLVSELESAFNKEAICKSYDPKLAKKAEEKIKSYLPGNPLVETVEGREYALLCQATYETPKGKASVLIPIELMGGNLSLPNVFLTPAGFENLTHKHIISHIQRTAGKRYNVNTKQIFNVIKKAKYGTIDDGKIINSSKELDPVERAVMLFKTKTASKATPDGILYQKIDPEVKSVQLPESKQTQMFGKQLSSVNGQAEFVFGKTAVNMGNSWIKKELAEYGYKNPQIKVASISDNKIIYAVNVAGAGFKVPIKIKNKKAIQPSMIITAGGIEEFSRFGIKNAMGMSDAKTSALALGYDIADSKSLLNEVETACNNGNVKHASEALSALGSTGDEVAIKYAFELYNQLLNGNQVKKATPKIKTIKIGGNIVEASTGLPIDKIYVDEQGNIKPKYRKNMEHTEEGTAAGFMNSKILMGM